MNLKLATAAVTLVAITACSTSRDVAYPPPPTASEVASKLPPLKTPVPVSPVDLRTAVLTLPADALAQITANLLSNVEKYAPEVPASLQTTQSEREFTLTIRDGGPGIAEKDAERVFEPFERLDDRVAAGVSGAGLGLSIARELARRMGGELRLVTVEKGASFEFRLPLPS